MHWAEGRQFGRRASCPTSPQISQRSLWFATVAGLGGGQEKVRSVCVCGMPVVCVVWYLCMFDCVDMCGMWGAYCVCGVFVVHVWCGVWGWTGWCVCGVYVGWGVWRWDCVYVCCAAPVHACVSSRTSSLTRPAVAQRARALCHCGARCKGCPEVIYNTWARKGRQKSAGTEVSWPRKCQ